mmetsp:Transcript_1509/g.1714  ORF Transcript_1509/g.1714 Transcript_1509/m.1714 type:complete len:191 (-) Transcript_1509:258-830(-)|eukprot:CAMPEP_0197848904 /NCGR_PEP_ID=MMETSP1438-20131217/10436_1 /TAXON_ID=1461541 /ORGANISM="Pterosperma sp., Strain CCMP1384" /LENGTH=190 /DNA_ID=CAMNT_0043461367 /DNA_START=154 /DNA_END=726 /DNA_ORIENTATION=+
MADAYKVCLVGPSNVGKSYLCRLLADTPGPPGYETTAGCRIQELERQVGSERVNVQVWDCSGDERYHGCLPALASGVNGLMLVYNPEKDDQESELERWYQAFASAGMGNLVTSLVRILAIKTSPGAPRKDYGMHGKLKRLHHTTVCLPPNPSEAKEGTAIAAQELDRLLEAIIVRKKEKEEQNIVDNSEY